MNIFNEKYKNKSMMQINKLNQNSVINSFRTKSKLQKKPVNEILQQTKTLLFKNSIFNYYENKCNHESIVSSFSKTNGKSRVFSARPLSLTNQCTPIKNKNNFNKNIFNKDNSKNYNTSDLMNYRRLLLNSGKSKNNFGNVYYFNFHKKNKRDKSDNIKINESFKKLLFDKIKKKIKENKQEKKFNQNQKFNSKDYLETQFIDFFYKWKKNDISCNSYNTKSIKNNRYYSDLIYDENLIFHYDFSKYIDDKINEYKNSCIENLKDKMESNFQDINQKDIKITLNGMKLIFIPLNKNNKNITLYLPLIYSLLFYYKGIDFFLRILLSIIHFDSSNFQDISINYDEINTFIKKKIFNNKNEGNKNSNDNNNTEVKIKRKHRRSLSVMKKNDKEVLFIKSRLIRKLTKYVPMFKKNNHRSKVKINSPVKEHSFFRRAKGKIPFHSNKNEKVFYNSYVFIWESPKVTYKVILEMPKITFKYQNISQNIILFCHRNMMLFLLKNNFINWDFYLMNYLFSIKAFRKFILKYLSYNNSFHINRELSPKTEESFDLNSLIYDKNKSLRTNNLYLLDNDNIIFDSFYNQLQLFNEKSETMHFFYTNDSNVNSLITLNSYQILVDCEKVNQNFLYEFFLNFKHMKFLDEVKRYEPLETFLLKIIKTDTEKGILSLDFSVFEDFQPKIINYIKKEVIIPYKIDTKNININFSNFRKSFRKPKNEVLLTIQKPKIIIEKYYSGTNPENKDINNKGSELIELDDILLYKMEKKKINDWSKLIVDFIENKLLLFKPNILASDSSQKHFFTQRTKKRSSTVMYSLDNSNKGNIFLELNKNL